MGMYTELVLKCTVSSEAPIKVREVLHFLFGAGSDPVTLPDHEFFECPRWKCIGNMSSFYHHPSQVNSLLEQCGDIHIFSRSDLKSYDGEIYKFIEWLKPYASCTEGECLGWTWYEEEVTPTLILK